MEELRECPFCGGKALQSYAGAKHIIICPNCVKLPADGGYVDSIDAVTAWNTRPDSWINFATENIDGQETYVNIPNDGQEILVSDGETVWQDTFYNDSDEGCYLDNGREIEPNFTHWMPLPEPPKGSEQMKRVAYTPMKGWFDLSKLNLPVKKFNAYAELQHLGNHYQQTYQYQKTYNSGQLAQLKELCAKMSLDLIENYGAIEKEPTPPGNGISSKK